MVCALVPALGAAQHGAVHTLLLSMCCQSEPVLWIWSCPCPDSPPLHLPEDQRDLHSPILFNVYIIIINIH